MHLYAGGPRRDSSLSEEKEEMGKQMMSASHCHLLHTTLQNYLYRKSSSQGIRIVFLTILMHFYHLLITTVVKQHGKKHVCLLVRGLVLYFTCLSLFLPDKEWRIICRSSCEDIDLNGFYGSLLCKLVHTCITKSSKLSQSNPSFFNHWVSCSYIQISQKVSEKTF